MSNKEILSDAELKSMYDKSVVFVKPVLTQIHKNITALISSSDKLYLRDYGELLEIIEVRGKLKTSNRKSPYTDYYLRLLSSDLENGEEGLNSELALKNLLKQLKSLDTFTPNPLYYGEPDSLGKSKHTRPLVCDGSLACNLQLGLFRDHGRTGKALCYGLIGFSSSLGLHVDDCGSDSLKLDAHFTLDTVYLHPKLQGLGLGRSMGIATGNLVTKYIINDLLKYQNPHPTTNTITFSADYYYNGSNAGCPMATSILGKLPRDSVWEFDYYDASEFMWE
jgi:hypothetical protein